MAWNAGWPLDDMQNIISGRQDGPKPLNTHIKMLDKDIIWTNSCTGLEK